MYDQLPSVCSWCIRVSCAVGDLVNHLGLPCKQRDMVHFLFMVAMLKPGGMV